jgi:hypothetical protein
MTINKNSISSPSFLYSTNDRNDSQEKLNLVPFACGRNEVSVSQIGTPNEMNFNPKTLKSQELMVFQESIANYRQKIQEMALATEHFITSLQQLADSVPEGILLFLIPAQIENPRLVSNLDFLIDSSQLVANANQTWAGNVAQQVEAPLDKIIEELPHLARGKHEANRQKLKILIQQLHTEEDLSYRLKKKRSRDTTAIQRVFFKTNASLCITEKFCQKKLDDFLIKMKTFMM